MMFFTVLISLNEECIIPKAFRLKLSEYFDYLPTEKVKNIHL